MIAITLSCDFSYIAVNDYVLPVPNRTDFHATDNYYLYILSSIRYIAHERFGRDYQAGFHPAYDRSGSQFMAGNGTPVYKKIQSTIRKRIQTSELKPGDAVASERELARTHGVSLMTARHALVGLEREGVVERRRGAGTFVASPKIHFNKLMSYSEQMFSRGLSPRSRVLAAKVVEHEPEIAARLRLPPSSKVVKIERLREANDEPLALETCYLPANEFANLVRTPLGRTSLFSVLNQNFDVELAYADEEVDATPADANVADLLCVSRGVPLLRIRQLIYSTQGKPIIYAVGFYRSECHTLFIRRFR